MLFNKEKSELINDIKIFTTGEDCLLEIEKEIPDCVILDFLIKDGTNGDDILKFIKDKHPYIDVIILSGQEDITIATDIIKNGAFDYIVKNKMTFFNLNCTLKNIKDKIFYKHKIKKSKRIYLLLIILVYVIGTISFIIKNKLI